MKVGVLEFIDTNASLPPAVLFIYYYKVDLIMEGKTKWINIYQISNQFLKQQINIINSKV